MSFTISDSDLDAIKDKVVIVTGASSGIGLATVKRVIQHGGKPFAADVNELPEPEKSTVPFLRVDVTSWNDQLALFKAAKEKYGVIDHVFANAGIAQKASLLESDVDENGDLLPPNLDTINVNLIGVMYTVKLAIYYIKQNPNGGSIVMTGSGSSFSRFSPTDYTTSKHAVLGLLRSLYTTLHPHLPIRINALAPSWTVTSIVPAAIVAAVGEQNTQPPDAVARSALNLMVDANRHGALIYSDRGRFWDIESGEDGLHAYPRKLLGDGYTAEEQALERVRAVLAKSHQAE